MTSWISSPDTAWCEHILPHTTDQNWIEDSSDISNDIALSKRELFSLIILAFMYSSEGDEWLVGYDSEDGEPNDGFIINGTNKVRIEHKVVAQMEPREVLDAILKTYDKQAIKGPDYGNGRVLVIQPNKAASHGGLVKISDLRDKIVDDCPFDKVLTLSLVSRKGESDEMAIMHIIQHYPDYDRTVTGAGMAQVDFNLLSGEAEVPHNALSLGVT